MDGGISGVIASRLVAEDGQQITIEVGKPTPTKGEGADCEFRIDGHRRTTHGDDELAALYCTPAEIGFPNPEIDQAAVVPEDVGEVVASRTISHDGQRHTVTIGHPFPASDNSFTLCPFRIGDQPRAVAGGWDGMQALLTAVRMIGAWLQLPQDWPLSTTP
ncbi:DUF6968 family protein [Nocardia terpenica]|uniref:DUF6968 domain-containing protein n=1 Tax=Nocardia terpenica TaxID=455432 RepID=A0A6G9Z9I4_9NOCA|nr:hypothetical protein [Nocardia terpenica]QIS22124.1 hypothetical protein F6W96_31045 [Nocardia terpenica]